MAEPHVALGVSPIGGPQQRTVILVFQPAKEGRGGAKIMLETGILENVDAIFGLHVLSRFPISTIASRSDLILAGSGFFEVVISGKGGHVVTMAKFQGGGAFAFNVIPDSVIIGGTFRAFSKESLMQLKQRIEEYSISLQINANDRASRNKRLCRGTTRLSTSTTRHFTPQPYFYRVGMQNETRGQLEPRHSLYFTVNEDVLPYGAAFHASLATRYLLEYQQPKSTSSKGSSRDEL
ncbi:hypothetical protein HYC85_026485 [Camellia sinensis]|uniref:Uncharacterized protein n=1 Tax=Camellia sinensis TaxID=4442 RepID=A0A7J7G7R6_CAMSI|nr:hypothetical protein HYC85_026485 [Camellia sinensis]